MDDKRLELRISSDLLRHVDLARGDVARAAWVKLAIQLALPAHLRVPVSPGVAKAMAALGSAQAVKAREAAARVYPASREREVQATRNIAEQSGVPEPVRGCPECGGELQLVEDRFAVGDGQSLVCEDCGWSR